MQEFALNEELMNIGECTPQEEVELLDLPLIFPFWSWMPYLLFYHQDGLPWQTVKSNKAKYYGKNPPNLWAKINLLFQNLVIQGIYYNDINLAQKGKT